MIPSFSIAGLLLLTAPSAETIRLDTSGEKLGNTFFEHMALTRDEGFLLKTNRRLFHWNKHGELINEIGGPRTQPNPIHWISAFYYDSVQGIYWICDLVQKKSFFFDRHGQVLGEGYQIDSSGKRDRIFFRQLIAVPDGIFAVDLSGINFWRNPEPRAVVGVTFQVVPEDGVLVQTSGPHFARLTQKQIALNYNFKLHWIVRESNHDNLYVVDQVSPNIRHFVPNPMGENGELGLQTPAIPMALPRYQPPPDTWDEISKTQEDFDRWWYSWSRVNGFYVLGEDFLVAYEISNPNNDRASLQALQRVSRDGKNIGDLLVLGDYLLGVAENRVYIFQERKEGEAYRYSVQVLQL